MLRARDASANGNQAARSAIRHAPAMLGNFMVAAFAGILIPLALTRAGFDPAAALGVLVTMTTDVAGFFGFLGLATLRLL